MSGARIARCAAPETPARPLQPKGHAIHRPSRRAARRRVGLSPGAAPIGAIKRFARHDRDGDREEGRVRRRDCREIGPEQEGRRRGVDGDAEHNHREPRRGQEGDSPIARVPARSRPHARAFRLALALRSRARALRDDQVSFIGFGSFEPRARAARTGRNPKTGEALQIAASTAVGFSASKVLKEAVNNKGMTP